MKYSSFLLFPALVMLASCGGSKENPEAVAMLDGATEAFQSGDLTRSTLLLDSLQKAFPGEISVQRRAMILRPQVIEKGAELMIASIDSMTIADNKTMEELKSQLKWVKTPGMVEGYYIDAKSYNPSFMNSTGIEARVNEIGQFYIVSSMNPSGNHHEAISVSGNGMSAATERVPYDGESNYRIDGGEVIAFSPEQSDTIGQCVATILEAVPSAKVSLGFIGGKGTKQMAMSPAQARGVATAYAYSKALIRARDNQVKRQRLEKTIEVARRQKAVAENEREE